MTVNVIVMEDVVTEVRVNEEISVPEPIVTVGPAAVLNSKPVGSVSIMVLFVWPVLNFFLDASASEKLTV